MPSTAIDRRRLLAAIAGFGMVPLAAHGRADDAPAFVAARRDGPSTYSVAVLDRAGRVLFSQALDGRGHDIAVSPDGQTAVVFARRPGIFALVIDVRHRRRLAVIRSPAGRHFYGHGAFSADGRLLYATENDFDGERGVLGIYDAAAGYVRIGEFDTHGVGPHEVILLNDGRTIAVCNGGIATHPDFARVKLNIPTMQPSLAYLDSTTGDLIDKVALPSSAHKLSIRHMAEAAGGTVWFGGQYEGGESDIIDLVGTHQPGRDPVLVTAPPAAYRDMRHYIGSIAANADGSLVAATSPVGGKVMVFDTRTRSMTDRWTIADVGGVTHAGSAFVTSDGGGRLWQGTTLVSETPGVAWDNHLRALR